MKTRLKAVLQRYPALLACFVPLLFGCNGCQTFSLTAEDWEKQQRGEMVDREVGNAVGIAGMAGFLGASIGGAVASAVKK